MNKIRPFVVLCWEPPECKPYDIANRFVGTVNSHPLPRGIGSRGLLCTSINAIQTDIGFEVRYEFIPNPDDQCVYEATNFNELNVDFSKEPEEPEVPK